MQNLISCVASLASSRAGKNMAAVKELTDLLKENGVEEGHVQTIIETYKLDSIKKFANAFQDRKEVKTLLCDAAQITALAAISSIRQVAIYKFPHAIIYI